MPTLDMGKLVRERLDRFSSYSGILRF